LQKNGSRIEVALDDGEVRVGRKCAPISELELELKRGKVTDVFKLAHEIGKVTRGRGLVAELGGFAGAQCRAMGGLLLLGNRCPVISLDD
jgi:hypothetical protein